MMQIMGRENLGSALNDHHAGKHAAKIAVVVEDPSAPNMYPRSGSIGDFSFGSQQSAALQALLESEFNSTQEPRSGGDLINDDDDLNSFTIVAKKKSSDMETPGTPKEILVASNTEKRVRRTSFSRQQAMLGQNSASDANGVRRNSFQFTKKKRTGSISKNLRSASEFSELALLDDENKSAVKDLIISNDEEVLNFLYDLQNGDTSNIEKLLKNGDLQRRASDVDILRGIDFDVLTIKNELSMLEKKDSSNSNDDYKVRDEPRDKRRESVILFEKALNFKTEQVNSNDDNKEKEEPRDKRRESVILFEKALNYKTESNDDSKAKEDSRDRRRDSFVSFERALAACDLKRITGDDPHGKRRESYYLFKNALDACNSRSATITEILEDEGHDDDGSSAEESESNNEDSLFPDHKSLNRMEMKDANEKAHIFQNRGRMDWIEAPLSNSDIRIITEKDQKKIMECHEYDDEQSTRKVERRKRKDSFGSEAIDGLNGMIDKLDVMSTSSKQTVDTEKTEKTKNNTKCNAKGQKADNTVTKEKKTKAEKKANSKKGNKTPKAEEKKKNKAKPSKLGEPDTNLVSSTDADGHLQVDRPEGWVGAYSPESRKIRLERFMKKRENRVWKKTVQYNVRKDFADSRLRVKGQFVKKADEVLMRCLLSLT